MQLRTLWDGFLQVLVGNKCDLESERQVPSERGENEAKDLNIGFVETSAKTGTNVQEVFHMLARLIASPKPDYKASQKKTFSVFKFPV